MEVVVTRCWSTYGDGWNQEIGFYGVVHYCKPSWLCAWSTSLWLTSLVGMILYEYLRMMSEGLFSDFVASI